MVTSPFHSMIAVQSARIAHPVSAPEQLQNQRFAIFRYRTREPQLSIEFGITRVKAFVEAGSGAELRSCDVPGEFHQLEARSGIGSRSDQPFVHQRSEEHTSELQSHS